MPEIPPWLNIDPTAPVGRLLEGYRSGLAASEAQRRANEQEQSFAIRQQELAQLAAYRQQQQDIQLQELRMAQEKAQREAAAAARQLEAQQNIQRGLAAGETFPKLLAQFGPQLFAGNPAGLAAAMERIRAPQTPIYGKTPEGAPWVQDARTGAIHIVPASALRSNFQPETIDLGGGYKAIRLSPQHIQIVERPPAEGSLTAIEKSRLAVIKQKEKEIAAELTSRERLPEKQAKLQELDDETQAIYNKKWTPKWKELRDAGVTSQFYAQPPAAAPTALPLPRTKAELVAGQTYQTSRGPATWDGTQFIQ